MRKSQRLFLSVSLLTAASLGAAAQPCRVQRIDASRWRLENQVLQVTIDASRSAGIESLVFKPKQVSLAIDPETAGGLSFMDRIYHQFEEDDGTAIETEYFNTYAFTPTVAANTPDCVALKLSCAGRSAPFQWLNLHKTYTLKAGEPALYVQHALANTTDAPHKAGIWVMTFLRASGLFPERNTFFNPTPDGIRLIAQPGLRASEQGDWVLAPPTNWKAVLGNGSRTGVVAVVEHPHLSRFYDWYSNSRSKVMSTFEWMTGQQSIPPRGEFRTTYALLAVTDFRRVDGVAGGRVACAVDLSKAAPKPGDEVEVKVCLAGIAKDGLTVAVDLVAQGEAASAKNIATETAALAPERASVVAGRFTAPGNGAYELQVTVSEGGKALGKVVRPFAVGDAPVDSRIPAPGDRKTGADFLFPIMHLRLPGAESIKFRPVRDITAEKAAKKEVELELTQEEKNLERARKNYPPLSFIEDISDRIVTPHFPWLKPRAGGKLKVLYMVRTRFQVSTAKREPVELAQRMSVDYTYVPLLDRILGRRGIFGMHSDQRGKDLEPYSVDRVRQECGKDYAVIVMSGVDLAKAQPEVTEHLLQAAATGKGVVVITTAKLPERLESVLTQGKTACPDNFHGLPRLNRNLPVPKAVNGLCRLARYGEGRLALIKRSEGRYPCVPPERRFERTPNYYGKEVPYWEYMKILELKAVAWAAGGPALTVDSFEVKDEAILLKVGGQPPKSVVLDVVFRDQYNEVDLERKWTLDPQAGGGAVSVPLPAMRGGFHLADYRLTDVDGLVHDCGSCAFETPFECEIVDVQLGKPSYRSGETVSATVRLKDVPARARLVAEVEDTHARTLCREERRLAGGEDQATFEFPGLTPLAILHRLFVRVENDSGVLARRMALFSFPFEVPPDDEIMGFVWYGQALGYKRWADLGFDTMIFSFRQATPGMLRSFCSQNLRPWGFGLPYMVGNPGHKGEGSYYGLDLVREPCFSDPAYWEKARDRCLKHFRETRQAFFGVRDYQLVDEIRMGPAVCFAEHCLAGFREYLQEQYADLAALNRGWGTTFAAWRDVRPIPLTEVDETKDNLPGWLDHRMFMNLVFARWVKGFKDILAADQPEVRMGLSGTGNPDTTYNWWELMKDIDCLANYGGMQEELILSFRPAASRTGRWTGGYVPTEEVWEPSQRGDVWEQLLRRKNTYYFFHGSSGGTCMLGDLRPSSNLQIAAAELRKLKQGPAKLLLSSDLAHDGVAVHFSQSSMFCAAGSIGQQFWLESGDSWSFLLHDMGLGFSFISYEQLAEGELSNDRFKVFVLPLSLSISSAEVKALQGFVRNGGVVIADYAPGIYDEHGKRAANTDLLDLFGVRRVDSDIRMAGCRMKLISSPQDNLEAGVLPIRYGESGLALTTGKSFGDTGAAGAPAMIVNRVGQGKAILLNCAISGYATTILGGQGGEMAQASRGDPKLTTPLRALVNDLLEGCGVVRQVRIATVADGRDFQPLTVTSRFRNGDLRYLGILRPRRGPGVIGPEEHLPVTVALAEPGHVYDVLDERYLGRINAMRTTIAGGVARLYAVLPYKVDRLSAKARQSFAAGDKVRIRLQVAASSGKLGTHIAHLDVLGPDGALRRHYSQNVKLTRGKGEATVPTALSDPSGPWQVIARDVASGVAASVEFELR